MFVFARDLSVLSGCPLERGVRKAAVDFIPPSEYLNSSLSISRHNLNYLKVWGWLSITIENSISN